MNRIIAAMGMLVLSGGAAPAIAQDSAGAAGGRSGCAQSDTLGRATPCAFRSPQQLPSYNARRSNIEFGLLYGVAVVAYFRDGRARQIDRDVWSGLKKVFSPDRIRFDDNNFYINNLSHPIGGLMYYGIPRTNGASATRSFLTLLGASVFWEQVVELQEIASINDHITTPISGWTVGEAVFQNRMFFRRSAPTTSNRVLEKAAGFPVNLSELFWSRPMPAQAPVTDRHGFADDVDHRFRIYLGASERTGPPLFLDGRYVDFGFESEIQPVGRRDRPGDRAGWFSGPATTQFDLGFSFRNGKMDDMHARAKVVPLAWYSHDVRTVANEPRGHSLIAGPAAEFEIEMLGANHQLYVARIAAHMLGGTLDYQALRGPLRARVVVDGYGNFAQVGSTGRLGNPERDDTPGESTLFKESAYYNALGSTGAARLSVAYGPVELSASARLHRLQLIERTLLDRKPDLAFRIRDKSDDWTTLWAGIALRPVDLIEVSLRREQRTFAGSIEDFHVRKQERSWQMRVSAAF